MPRKAESKESESERVRFFLFTGMYILNAALSLRIANDPDSYRDQLITELRISLLFAAHI
jgi:hypothetical protein